jgi:hypothetical protein
MRLDFQTIVNVEKEEESKSKVEPEEPTTTSRLYQQNLFHTLQD